MSSTNVRPVFFYHALCWEKRLRSVLQLGCVPVDPIDRAPVSILIVSTQFDKLGLTAASFARESGLVLNVENDLNKVSQRVQRESPSLVVFDREPTARLLDLIIALKSGAGSGGVGVIVLARANEAKDRIAALEAGADDYLAKPFNRREAILRMKAVLRRGRKSSTDDRLVSGPIVLDAARYRVAIEGQPVRLTAVEFKLLQTLLAQSGRIQSRHALLHAVRGNGQLQETRTIDTHIRRLRGKLGKAAHLVETIRGSGYRLRLD